MPAFLRSVVSQKVALAVSTQTDLIDLPVNPISHILLTLYSNNNTSTLSNYRQITSFAAWLSRVEVLFKGQSIIEGSLQDLLIMNALLTGFIPYQQTQANADNYQRACTFMLSFSRVPYWREEAFPATSKGELQIRLQSGAAPTGMDTLFYNIETVELLDANPARFIKYTTYTTTQGVTGRFDADLPRGNPILGVMLFGTTVSTATTSVNTIEDVALKVDNVEQYYSLANWAALHGEISRKLGAGLWNIQGHYHPTPTDLTTAGDQTEQAEFSDELLELYAYLDFDPLKDSQYALVTEGRGRVALRINAGDTEAARMMPVELVGVQGGG